MRTVCSTMAHVPRGISWHEPNLRVSDTVATGLLKNNPDFLSIKIPKTQINKPSSNLQIPPKLTLKC